MSFLLFINFIDWHKLLYFLRLFLKLLKNNFVKILFMLLILYTWNLFSKQTNWDYSFFCWPLFFEFNSLFFLCTFLRENFRFSFYDNYFPHFLLFFLLFDNFRFSNFLLNNEFFFLRNILLNQLNLWMLFYSLILILLTYFLSNLCFVQKVLSLIIMIINFW